MNNLALQQGCEKIMGKRVFSYTGEFLGEVSNVDLDEFFIEKRLLGFGPVISRKLILTDEIDKIESNFVTLRLNQSQYWQYPEEEQEAFSGRYFIL